MTLQVRQPMALTPSEVVENASTQAKLLMDIVEKTGCFQLIAKKKYLQVEAWETIGAFNRVHAVTESIHPITKEGDTIGYEAVVKLWRDNEVVGGAIMPCFFSENACRGKEGDAKHKAAMSAAQTFATSKAYRMNYSYVAILAGYEPTPAEEVTGEDTLGTASRDNKQEHWCATHKTNFFKRGRMKDFAHPIDGTEPQQWCNEEPAPPPGEPHATETGVIDVKATQTTKSESDHDFAAMSEESKRIEADEKWGFVQGSELKYSLKSLNWPMKDCGQWIERNLKVTGKTLREVVTKLNEEQAKSLVKEINDRLEITGRS